MRDWPTESMRAKTHLRLGDRVVVETADQLVRGGPGLFVGFAHDHMKADAEGDLTPTARARARTVSSFSATSAGGSPSEIFVDHACRDLVGRLPTSPTK